MLRLTDITEDRFGMQYRYTFRDADTNRVHTVEYADITKLKNVQISNAAYVSSRFPYLQYSGNVRRTIIKTIYVYHGSDHVIKRPYSNKYNTRSHNDYGRGFYTAQFPVMADEWAVLHTAGTDKTPVRNMYQLDLSGLTVLNLNKKGIPAWIAEVLFHRMPDHTQEDIIAEYCRRYRINSAGYDIIMGYRADDSCFAAAEVFVNNIISAEEISTLFSRLSLGRQICLKSGKAFSQLKFAGSSAVTGADYKYIADRDNSIRKQIIKYISDRRYAVQIGGEKPAGVTFTEAVLRKQEE